MTRFEGRVALGLMTTLAWLATPAPGRAGVTWTFGKVADTSTAVPGGTGTFATFGDPALSNGYVTFQATGSGRQQGIYEEAAGGTLQKVADVHTAAPSGGNFISFERPSVDADVAFVATTTTGQGVYESVGGQIRTVATSGTPTPGYPGGTFFSFANAGSAVINNGAVTFEGFSHTFGGTSIRGSTWNMGARRPWWPTARPPCPMATAPSR